MAQQRANGSGNSLARFRCNVAVAGHADNQGKRRRLPIVRRVNLHGTNYRCAARRYGILAVWS
jgi:hypothetical protein